MNTISASDTIPDKRIISAILTQYWTNEILRTKIDIFFDDFNKKNGSSITFLTVKDFYSNLITEQDVIDSIHAAISQMNDCDFFSENIVIRDFLELVKAKVVHIEHHNHDNNFVWPFIFQKEFEVLESFYKDILFWS